MEIFLVVGLSLLFISVVTEICKRMSVSPFIGLFVTGFFLAPYMSLPNLHYNYFMQLALSFILYNAGREFNFFTFYEIGRSYKKSSLFILPFLLIFTPLVKIILDLSWSLSAYFSLGLLICAPTSILLSTFSTKKENFLSIIRGSSLLIFILATFFISKSNVALLFSLTLLISFFCSFIYFQWQKKDCKEERYLALVALLSLGCFFNLSLKGSIPLFSFFMGAVIGYFDPKKSPFVVFTDKIQYLFFIAVSSILPTKKILLNYGIELVVVFLLLSLFYFMVLFSNNLEKFITIEYKVMDKSMEYIIFYKDSIIYRGII